MIAGYVGGSDKADRGLCRFARPYADQTERHHAALLAAADRGLSPLRGRCLTVETASIPHADASPTEGMLSSSVPPGTPCRQGPRPAGTDVSREQSGRESTEEPEDALRSIQHKVSGGEEVGRR